MDYRILSSNINYKECRDVIAIDDDGLVISFHRTVRVPETEKMSAALPDLGRFPLYAVDEFKDKLPDHISEKGGLFFPMHEREAMWIRLTSKQKFAIKIYADGVNAVSGESANEMTAAKLQRQKDMADGASVQDDDYVVTPQQIWVDGIRTFENEVRQFVGASSDVKAQTAAVLQFEITKKINVLQDEIYVEFPGDTKTPLLVDLDMSFSDFQKLVQQGFNISEDDCIIKFQGAHCKGRTVRECGIQRRDTIHITPPGSTISPDQPGFGITVTTLMPNKKPIPLEVCAEMEFIEVKELLQKIVNIPADDLRLIYLGKGLMDHWKLKEFDVKQHSNLHMVSRLQPRIKRLHPSTIAEIHTPPANSGGGLLSKQSINPQHDTHSPEPWDHSSTTILNVHMLNAALFHSVTGIPPPECPIDKSTYTNLGLPVYEQPTDQGFWSRRIPRVPDIQKIWTSISSLAKKKEGS